MITATKFLKNKIRKDEYGNLIWTQREVESIIEEYANLKAREAADNAWDSAI